MLEAALLLRTVGVDTQLPEEEAEVSLFLGDQALDLMQALPHLLRRGIREVLGHAELVGCADQGLDHSVVKLDGLSLPFLRGRRLPGALIPHPFIQ
jgi:hypothetical protein